MHLSLSSGILTLSNLLLLIVAQVATAADKPNVVIIYGDDVGFADVGVNGSMLIPTPNIDRFAAGGLNFTDAHCTSANCTPSRFSIMTGIHAFRYNAQVLPPNAPLIIPTDMTTIGDVFKQAGYATSIIGKWHLGIGEKGTPANWNGEAKPGPLELGFDNSFLIPSTNDRVPTVYLKGHRVVNLDPEDPLYVSDDLEEIRAKAESTQYPDGKTNRDAMTYYESSWGHENSVINGIARMGYMAGGESALWDDESISDNLVEEAERFISRNKDGPFFLSA